MGDAPEDRGLVLNLGPVAIDVPRSLGFFGGVGLAVAVGLIEPPLGIFIALVPAMRMLTNRQAPHAVRFVGQVLEGAAKPVGGDAEGTVTLQDRGVDEAERSARRAPGAAKPGLAPVGAVQ